MPGAQQHAAQREVRFIILWRKRQRGAILLDGLGEFPGVFERETRQKSRAAFGGLQFGCVKKCFRGRRRVRYPSAPGRDSGARRHLRVQRNRAREFSSCILRALQSDVRITKLKMRVGIVGPLRDVFLKRIERRGEILFVDRVLRLLQQRRERVFLLVVKRISPAAFAGDLSLRLRGQRHSGCGKHDGNQPHVGPGELRVCPEDHFDDLRRHARIPSAVVVIWLTGY